MSCVRIAMWSGPRNISTTMMRSFENRPDCAVVDEPLYAHFLAQTGLNHPMREEVLAAQSQDWRDVVAELTTAAPAPLFFQKHMCQHITPDMDLDWLADVRSFFLIRDPARMIASYAQKMDTVTLEALGLPQQKALFEKVRSLTGTAPPVVDAQDVLTDPRGVLSTLCGQLGIAFADDMLAWPAGTRDSDGVWAPHWYDQVHTSTGFRTPPAAPPAPLPAALAPLTEAAQEIYAQFCRVKISAGV